MDLSLFALTGKVAIITGGGRGIGRAIALGLARGGADVVVAARTASAIEDAAAKIRGEGRNALAVPTDVRNIDQITNLLERTLNAFNRVDILVNNAGGSFSVPFIRLSANAWEAVIKENLSSVFLCSRIIGEAMVKQKTGNIINISSAVGGLSPYPNYAHYAAAKAGIIGLTKTLAVELAPYNIRVNAIAPGIVPTPGSNKATQAPPEYREAQLKRIPLGRFGQPEDIAGAAVFLASDASAYITGETIAITGGLTTTVFSL